MLDPFIFEIAEFPDPQMNGHHLPDVVFGCVLEHNV
jgi:hypothetical protein